MSEILAKYTQETINQLAEAAFLMKDTVEPDEMIDNLFDMQTEMIRTRFMVDCNEEGRKVIAFNFEAIRDFMRILQKIELIEK